MRINSTHPTYDSALPAWLRARDVLAGEDAVKAAGVKYLPRLDSQSAEEYAAYVARASFFGAAARTLEEYLDLVFRRTPSFALRATEGRPSGMLGALIADSDGWGTPFVRYARSVVSEVLAAGRAGSLVLWGADGCRPHVSLWRAEEILNWEVTRSGGRTVLTKLVLLQRAEGGNLKPEVVRVLCMVGPGCVQEVWTLARDQRDVRDGSVPGSELALQERVTLRREGVPLGFIPFVFHGPQHSRPEPDRLPLAEIIAAHLATGQTVAMAGWIHSSLGSLHNLGIPALRVVHEFVEVGSGTLGTAKVQPLGDLLY